MPPKAVGLRGRGVQNTAQDSPEGSSSSDPLPQLYKEHLSPCSYRRPGHRLLFPISLSETFLFGVRHGAKETRALSRSCYGSRNP